MQRAQSRGARRSGCASTLMAEAATQILRSSRRTSFALDPGKYALPKSAPLKRRQDREKLQVRAAQPGEAKPGRARDFAAAHQDEARGARLASAQIGDHRRGRIRVGRPGIHGSESFTQPLRFPYRQLRDQQRIAATGVELIGGRGEWSGWVHLWIVVPQPPIVVSQPPIGCVRCATRKSYRSVSPGRLS